MGEATVKLMLYKYFSFAFIQANVRDHVRDAEGVQRHRGGAVHGRAQVPEEDQGAGRGDHVPVRQ